MATKCIIPIIDLQDFPNQISNLIAACEEWGCFRLVNFHQVLPTTLMSEMKTVVRSLFDLPEEIKRRNVEVFPGSGYVPTDKKPLNEAFGFFDMASQRDVENFCSSLDASPHQRETIMRYAKAVHELLGWTVEKLAQGLEVKSENGKIENWPCMCRINKYPFTPEQVGSLGIGLHTDSSFLTILQDDEEVDGLEIVNKAGEFVAVDPWPDTLLVNIGDLAKIWSNGRFVNVKHRVQCKKATTRLSIASFLFGPTGTVEPLEELVNDDCPRVYVPTTYDEVRELRFSTGLHEGQALELLYTPSFKKEVIEP